MKKILVTTSTFGKMDPAPLAKLQNSGCRVVLNPHGRKLSEEEVSALLTKHQPAALIAGVEPLTESALRAGLPALKIISRCGSGLESVDLKAAEKLSITVTSTPDAPTVPVAELTMGLILGILRRIHIADAAIREGRWERPLGSLLYHKTVGIIGCGRIGTRLARMLSGFDCRVIGYDPLLPRSAFFELKELDELLKMSDLVTLHLPYSAENNHFIDQKRLQIMKKGSYLINASRGGLVDEEALYRALKAGPLAGAALDTFEQEPYRGPLKELENVLLTGHIGSYAREARVMMEMQAVDNLLQHL